MISSPLTDAEYDRLVPDYEGYRDRKIGDLEEGESESGDHGEGEA